MPGRTGWRVGPNKKGERVPGALFIVVVGTVFTALAAPAETKQ